MNPLNVVQPFFRKGSAEWNDGWWHGLVVGFVSLIIGMIVGFII